MVTEKIDLKEALLLNLQRQNTGNKIDLSLLELRQDALTALANLDIPTSKHEEWKYTDISKALKRNFDFTSFPERVQYSSQQIDQVKFSGLDAYYLVFINGNFVKQL